MRYSNDYVQVAVYVISEYGWDNADVWVPREVAEAESQDDFLKWVYSKAGEGWRDTWGDVQAVFIASFNFEEPSDGSIFIRKGTKVRVASAADTTLSPNVNDLGTLQADCRIGKGVDVLVDVLLDNGNECSVYGHQLEVEVLPVKRRKRG